MNWINFIAGLACALISLSPSLTYAQSQRLDIRPNAERLRSDDLLLAFKGTTHDGSYNFNYEGLAGNHYLETHLPDSRVIYRENGEDHAGVWTIRKDKMCYTYASNNMGGGCFRVYRIKNCYYFYSDNLIERKDELDQNYWTARSTLKGQDPLCVTGMS